MEWKGHSLGSSRDLDLNPGPWAHWFSVASKVLNSFLTCKMGR